jgi:sarcosine oxidase, subunit gamma
MPESTPWLRILEPAARFILQGGPAVRAAAGPAFGVALPEVACRANSAGERSALWLGPDEFLLFAPEGAAHRIAVELEIALSGIAHSLVEVSDRQVAMEVSGPYSDAILNSGCPLDLDLTRFPTGMCTRTLFGKADIVLWRTDATAFHLEIWRSFSEYMLGCIRDAAWALTTPVT